MDLTWANVSPFLSPRAKAQQAWIEPRLPGIALRLTRRYGEALTPERLPLIFETVADAIERRLKMLSSTGISRQSVGGASVDYDKRMPLTGWFLPGELADMDDLCGFGGGIRSVRLSAPNAIRYGNMAGEPEED